MHDNTGGSDFGYKEAPANKTGFTIISLIHMTIALIIVAWLNIGIFTFALPYFPTYMRWGLFAIWFGMALIMNKNFFSTFLIQSWPLIILWFYLLVTYVFTNDIQAFVLIQNILVLLLVYSIFLYYFGREHIKFQKLMSKFLFFDYCIVAIITFIQLQINPSIVRALSTSQETMRNSLGDEVYYGVGNYGYFYGLVPIVLLLAFSFFNYRKRRVPVLFAAFAFMILLLQASFSIALLLLLFFLTVIVIHRYTNQHVFAIVIFGVIVSIMLFSAFSIILEEIANLDFIPDVVSTRINELSELFSGTDVSGTNLSGRLDLYLNSVNAFLDSMLFGAILDDSNEFVGGNHSAWLDLLANYGMASFLYFAFLFKAYRYCKIRLPIKFGSFINVYWMYFICLGVINNVTSANIFMTWFLFLPMVISAFFKIDDESSYSGVSGQ